MALISLRNIRKTFGAVEALGGVSLEIAPGDRLALVGENGAGKSSLMNVLYGLYRPDEGEIAIDGAKVELRSPREAIGRGIGMVHQHFTLVPPFTVTENVVLGDEPTRGPALDRARARAKVLETCQRFGFQLDPDATVESLSVGSQQKVEIVKALYRGAKVLILDEPTAVLTPQESDELFRVCRALSEAGHAVVFITHHLDEVLAVATRIAVMRRGKLVTEVRPTETSVESLAEAMVGHKVERASAQPGRPTETVLAVRDLVAESDRGLPAVRGVSFEVRAGEIVGLAGVDGNGQTELVEALTGLRPARGEMRLSGQSVLGASPAALRALGLAHVPEDRLRRAIVGPLSVEENFSLGRQRSAPFARSGRLDFAARRARSQELIEAFDVRPTDPTVRIGGLSGGNQQKVVVARELDSKPRLLVVVQPTRGLDIAAVETVHRKLRAARDAGCAVLLVSLDLDELLNVSDRIHAIYEGRITGSLERNAYDVRALGRLMLGAEAAHG